jgi:shikimate dehydrogenase
VVIANRTADKAAALAAAFADLGMVSGGGLDGPAGQHFDVVINGTAASLAGQALALPASLDVSGGFAYDLVYAREPTPFMRWAEARGASGTSDGLGMLVEQAAESFLVWRGVRPQTAPVIAALRAET